MKKVFGIGSCMVGIVLVISGAAADTSHDIPLCDSFSP